MVIAHRVWNFCMLYSVFVFIILIKVLATNVKMQKIEPHCNFFYDGRKFRRHTQHEVECIFFTCENFRWQFQNSMCNDLKSCFRIQQQHPVVCFIFVSLSCQLQLWERADSWRRRGWLKGSVGSEEDRSTAATTRATEQVIFHDKSHMVMQHSEPIKHADSISIKLPAFFVILGLSIDKKNH